MSSGIRITFEETDGTQTNIQIDQATWIKVFGRALLSSSHIRYHGVLYTKHIDNVNHWIEREVIEFNV